MIAYGLASNDNIMKENLIPIHFDEMMILVQVGVRNHKLFLLEIKPAEDEGVDWQVLIRIQNIFLLKPAVVEEVNIFWMLFTYEGI